MSFGSVAHRLTRVRVLLPLAGLLLALGVTPAWASGHESHGNHQATVEHCAPDAHPDPAAQAVPTEGRSSSQVDAPASPCDQCPDNSCDGGMQCVAGFAGPVGEASLSVTLSLPAFGPSRPPIPEAPHSADTSPPVPPPNILSVR